VIGKIEWTVFRAKPTSAEDLTSGSFLSVIVGPWGLAAIKGQPEQGSDDCDAYIPTTTAGGWHEAGQSLQRRLWFTGGYPSLANTATSFATFACGSAETLSWGGRVAGSCGLGCGDKVPQGYIVVHKPY
jgi:hypothetical protein